MSRSPATPRPDDTPRRLLIVSGPSCAGKSPLVAALGRLHADLVAPFEQPVLYTSRAPRPGETDGEDYHFRSRAQIERLEEDDDHRVFTVHDDLQAIDLAAFRDLLGACDVLYEGNEAVALALIEAAREPTTDPPEILDVFLAPLARAEVDALSDAADDFAGHLTGLMRRRLLRRAAGMHPVLDLPTLRDIETRAADAVPALAAAHRFGRVLPCHDGEDSDHWSGLPVPVGDARRAVRALAALLRGEDDPAFESWPAELI